MNLRGLSWWLLASLACGTPWAGAAVSGGTEGPFALGVDARAQSLGRAYTAVAEDAGAIDWNPAGLGVLQRGDITALYIPLYTETDYGFLGLAYPVADFGTLGLGVCSLWTRGIAKTDEEDNDLGAIADLQSQILLSYSRIWWNHLSLGLNFKVYNHSLDNHTGTGFGLDAGAFYQAEDFLPGLTLGLAAANAVQPRVTLVSQPDTYPLNLRLGLAYRRALDAAGDHALLVSVEAEKSTWLPFQSHAGLEYGLLHKIFLRGGWDQDRLTAGLGLAAWDVRLDYAVAFPKEFGLLHMLSLGWSFGPTLKELDEKKRQVIITQLARAQAQAHHQRGLEYLRQGDYPKALEELETASHWDENASDILVDLKNAQQAYNHFQADQYNTEGRRCFEQKQYFNAFLAWRETAELEPNFPGILKQLMQVREALASATTASKIGKNAKTAKHAGRNHKLFQQGIDFYMDGKWSQAVSVWRQILQDDAQYPQIRDYLARAQEKLGAAKADAPQDGSAFSRSEELYKQGLLKYRRREFNEARSLWEQAVALTPNYAEARRGLERIQAIFQALDKK